MRPVRVLSVTPEIHPLIKTGGLADVAGALPKALPPLGVEMRSIVPGYPRVLQHAGSGEPQHSFRDFFGGDARILRTVIDGLDLYVLDAPHLYDRPGSPYQSPEGMDWADNDFRFAGLAFAGSEIGLGRVGAWRPDVVHAHDWQAGLAPAYLALSGQSRPATVITLHNLAFQGQFPAHRLRDLRLPPESWSPDGVEYYQSLGFLKAGLHYADRITTVSPTYAREIQTPETGMGMQGLLKKRAADLLGIVNGIDDMIWDPATDPHLAARYTARRLASRASNKRALRERFGLDAGHDGPLIGVVTRLTWQKGMDLLLEVLPNWLALGGQVALLGSGDAALEWGFADAKHAHAGQVGCVFGYDEGLSHLIQGGADMILAPSRFEPCGLTQLYGLRYGAVPVVARVGGLADTVVDANEAALDDGIATGVQFAPVTAAALDDALLRAATLYRQKKIWRAIQRRGMSRKLGWPHRAEAYASLYRSLLPSAAHG